MSAWQESEGLRAAVRALRFERRRPSAADRPRDVSTFTMTRAAAEAIRLATAERDAKP